MYRNNLLHTDILKINRIFTSNRLKWLIQILDYSEVRKLKFWRNWYFFPTFGWYICLLYVLHIWGSGENDHTSVCSIFTINIYGISLVLLHAWSSVESDYFPVCLIWTIAFCSLPLLASHDVEMIQGLCVTLSIP